MALLTVLVALSVLSLLSATLLADANWALRRGAERVHSVERRWAEEACVAVLRAHRVVPATRLDLGTGRWCVARRIDPGAFVHRASILAVTLATREPVAERRERWLTDLGDGRLSLAVAPPILLALLPGLDARAVQIVTSQQRTGLPFRTLDEFIGTLPGESREAAQAAFPELIRLAAPRSDVIGVVVEGGNASSRRVSRSVYDARVIGDSIMLMSRRSAS